MKNAFQFQAQPRAVCSSISIDKLNSTNNVLLYRNLMVDYRVVRGNTYSKHYQTKFYESSENDLTVIKKFNKQKNEKMLNLHFPRTQNLFQQSKIKKSSNLLPIRKSILQTNTSKDNRQNYCVSQGVYVSHYDRLQTNLPAYYDKSTMTEFVMEKKKHDLTYEFKIGEHKYTQIDEQELFNWDKEAEPIIQALKVRILRDSLIEAQQEQEIQVLNSVQKKIKENIDLEKQKEKNVKNSLKKIDRQKKQKIEAKKILQEKKIDLHQRLICKSYSHKIVNRMEKTLIYQREIFNLTWWDKFKFQFEDKAHTTCKSVVELVQKFNLASKNSQNQIENLNSKILNTHKQIVIEKNKNLALKERELVEEQYHLQKERQLRHQKKRLKLKKQKIQAIKDVFQKKIKPNMTDAKESLIVQDLQTIQFDKIENYQNKVFIMGGLFFELQTLFDWLEQTNEEEIKIEIKELIRLFLFQLQQKKIDIQILFEQDVLNYLEEKEIIIDDLSLQQLQTIENAELLQELLLEKLANKNYKIFFGQIFQVYMQDNLTNIQLQIQEQKEENVDEEDEEKEEGQNEQKLKNEQNLIILSQKIEDQEENNIEDEQSIQSEEEEEGSQQKLKKLSIYQQEIYNTEDFSNFLRENENTQQTLQVFNQDLQNQPKAKYFLYNFNAQQQIFQILQDGLNEQIGEVSGQYKEFRDNRLKQKFSGFVEEQKTLNKKFEFVCCQIQKDDAN